MVSTLWMASGYLAVLLLSVLATFYVERKLSAFIQDRMGPTEVGPKGTLQAVADLLKLLQKEDITPSTADKSLFRLAPWLIFTVVFAGFIALPWGPDAFAARPETGVFLLLTLVSLDVVALLMAGWSAGSKFPLLGAVRAVAQIISYEVPLGLIVLAVLVWTGTLDLYQISWQQSAQALEPLGLLGLPAEWLNVRSWGGLFTWNIVQNPLLIPAFVIFYIATLAEANRAPFDIPEGESELVGGFHTEYTGFRFAIFFLAEYSMMILLAALGSLLFLGGFNSPLPNIGPVALATWTSGSPGTLAGNAWGLFWLLSKTLLWAFSHVWVRWTFPRLRMDQLMYLGWQVLTPLALGILVLVAIWKVWLLGY